MSFNALRFEVPIWPTIAVYKPNKTTHDRNGDEG